MPVRPFHRLSPNGVAPKVWLRERGLMSMSGQLQTITTRLWRAHRFAAWMSRFLPSFFPVHSKPIGIAKPCLT